MGYLQGRSRSPPPEWNQIQLCRHLNQLLGTNLAPWELRQIPEVWVDLIVSMTNMQADLAEKGQLKNG